MRCDRRIRKCKNQLLKDDISQHLEIFVEMQRYLSELNGDEAAFARSPFSGNCAINVSDELQDEFLQLRNDFLARDLFSEKSLTQFCYAVQLSYPSLTMLAFRWLLLFVFTCFCEAGFSTLVHIKIKPRNELDIEEDMRLVFTNTSLRILRLATQTQSQSSH